MSSPSATETEISRPVFHTDVSAECAVPSDDATLLASSTVQRAMDGAASPAMEVEAPWSVDAHVCSDAAVSDGASPDASASGSASDLATDRPGCKVCMGTLHDPDCAMPAAQSSLRDSSAEQLESLVAVGLSVDEERLVVGEASSEPAGVATTAPREAVAVLPHVCAHWQALGELSAEGASTLDTLPRVRCTRCPDKDFGRSEVLQSRLRCMSTSTDDPTSFSWRSDIPRSARD